MKKILLLFAMGSFCLSAIAQQNNSVLLMPAKARLETPRQGLYQVANPVQRAMNYNHQHSTMRTTSTTYADWFDYYDQNASSTPSIYYSITYPDSNLVDNTGSTPYNVYCHGMGMSFDPTDGAYYELYGASTTYPISDGPITQTQAYSIDSFLVPFQYVHNDLTSGTDSLIIELIATSMITGSGSTAAYDSGTYELMYNANASFLNVTADSTPRFASAIYTRQISALGASEVWDSIITTKQRYAFALSDADTASGNGLVFPLSAPLYVQAGRKVVSYVHFKNATSYPLGTVVGSANYIKLYSGTTESSSTEFPQQTAHDASGVPTGYPGSYQTGLIAQNQVRYEDTGFTYNGHNILIPGVLFTQPTFAVTLQAFHVLWPPFAPISGVTSICVGSHTTLSDPSGSGTWSSSVPAVATVNSSGYVTGVSTGTTVISYTTGSGGTYATVTVLPVPTTPTITGAAPVCSGQTVTLTSSEGGGAWSSGSTSIATVNSAGVVTGVSGGTAVITYTVANICGSSYGTASVTINPSPTVAAITSTHDTVCSGHTITLADATAGGTWSSASTSVATISSSGVVGGVAYGTDVISYTVTSAGCSSSATLSITVYCTTGVSNVNGPAAENINVYPNPNNGSFNVLLSSPVDQQAVVRITNITGQVVKEMTIPTNKVTDMQLIEPTGIYFISATLSQGPYVQKITVTK